MVVEKVAAKTGQSGQAAVCMDAKTSGDKNAWIRPRLRVMQGKEIALGPGRVDLLEFIDQTGSLRAAAERMGISYMRAWNLLKSMNRCFREPLVEVVRGGKTGGGAELTRKGKEAVSLYRDMEKQCLRAVAKDSKALRKLM
jgi:molybdate transport system regulatory protein